MQQSNPLSEQESLALIESMINKAKNRFTETGHLYLLWGWTVLLCSLGQFVLLTIAHTGKSYYIWFLTWIVTAYQIWYIFKKKKRETVKTYTSEIIGYVWLAFVVAMFLMAYITGFGHADVQYIILYPLLFVLYGIPTFLSGIILRFKPLVAGGISCWVIAAIAPFADFIYQLLLLAAIMVIAWIVPGYLLQARYKKTNM